MDNLLAQVNKLKVNEISSETCATTDSGVVDCEYDALHNKDEYENEDNKKRTGTGPKSHDKLQSSSELQQCDSGFCGNYEDNSETVTNETVVPKQSPPVVRSVVDLQNLVVSVYDPSIAQEKVLQGFKQDPDGENDLMIAIMHSDEPYYMQVVAFIVDNAPDAALLDMRNKHGMTALIFATLCNNLFAIHRLRLAGADPNKCDYMGNSAMFYAAFHGNVKALSALTSNIADETVRAYRSAFKRKIVRADVNIRNCDGKTALHVAAERNHEKAIQVLNNMRADPNLTENSAGRTPLHVAVECGHYDCVTALTRFEDIDINSLTYADRTPLDCTKHLTGGCGERIARVLKEYGAVNGRDSDMEDSSDSEMEDD